MPAIYYFQQFMSKAKNSILLRVPDGRWPPLVRGIIVFVVLMLLITGVIFSDDRPIVWETYEFGTQFALAVTFILIVTPIINRVHVRDLDYLLSISEMDEAETKIWKSKISQHYSLIIETIAAFGVALLHCYLQGYMVLFTGTPRFFYSAIWGAFQVIAMWILITQSTSIFIRNMTLMNELSAKVRIDLLNMERFMPLTRAGVWSILGFIGVYSILFAGGVDRIRLTDPSVLIIAPTIFWMVRTPLKGFRKRVVKEKERELAIIDAAIEGDHEAMKASRIGANLANINVVDLISYKRIIQTTFEIPVNIPTASRFVFYLIIPLLTWIAASMVDKIVDYLIT